MGFAWRAAGPRRSTGRLCLSPSPLPAGVGVMGLPKRGLEVVISSFLYEGPAQAALEVSCLEATALGGGKDRLIQPAGCARLFQIREMSNQTLQISSNGNPPFHITLIVEI